MTQKKITQGQRTGRIGEVLTELIALSELGFLFHPTNALEAGTDGFIEVCDLDTGSPTGRYVAVQVKATDTGQPDYSASKKDVEYWQNQNVPFLLLRILRPEGIILWKVIDPTTRAGRIRFSLESDRLDDSAAPKIAGLVDDRYRRDAPEFRKRLAKHAIEDAEFAFDDSDFTSSEKHASRAVVLASAAADTQLETQALYIRISAGINRVVASCLPPLEEQWAADLARIAEIDDDHGRRLLLSARISLLLGDPQGMRTHLSRARTIIPVDGPGAVDLCQLSIQLCRPSVGKAGMPALVELQPLVESVFSVASANSRVLLLASLIGARAELDAIETDDIERLLTTIKEVDEDHAVVLLELESLTRFLMHHGLQSESLAVARSMHSLSLACGVFRCAHASEHVAQLLGRAAVQTKDDAVSLLEEAVRIRQESQSELLREAGSQGSLQSPELEAYVTLWTNRLQDEWRLLKAGPDAYNFRLWTELESRCSELSDWFERRKDSIRGDVDAIEAVLFCLRGDIAADMSQYETAVTYFRAAHRATGMKSYELRFRAACDSAYFSAIRGRYEKARDFLSDAENLAKSEREHEVIRSHNEMISDVEKMATWVKSKDAERIGESARESGIRNAMKPTINRILTHWEDSGGPCPVLYDYWGRGAFQRLAAAMRGAPDDAIAVDAVSVQEIEKAAQMLCPLFECVLVKWKGPLAQGIAVAGVRHGRDSEAGWLCGYGFANCADVADGMYGIVGTLNSIPEEVVNWLGNAGRGLFESGRILVVPAAPVGCTQPAVGWTDDALLSRLLEGVVAGVGGGTAPNADGQSDLANVKIPYFGGPRLTMADLSHVLEDIGDDIGPFRRRIWSVLAEQETSPFRVAARKALRFEIEDAIIQIQRQIQTTVKNTSIELSTSSLQIQAAERQSHVCAPQSLTESLHAISGVSATDRAWVTYWKMRELGGRFEWGAPTNNSGQGIQGLMTSWLSPPSRGAGLAVARKLE